MLGITRYDKGGLGWRSCARSRPRAISTRFTLPTSVDGRSEPADFFRTIEDDAGVDLCLVLAWLVLRPASRPGRHHRHAAEGESRNARVTIENRAFVFPVTMLVEYEDGSA